MNSNNNNYALSNMDLFLIGMGSFVEILDSSS